MTDSCKGNFIVYHNGAVYEDRRDFAALSSQYFNEKRGSSWTPWIGLSDEVEFIACLWEIPGGLKACVTDREFNSLELLDVSVETAASVLRQAQQLRAVTPERPVFTNNNPENGWTA